MIQMLVKDRFNMDTNYQNLSYTIIIDVHQAIVSSGTETDVNPQLL